jgi:lipid-A-disaccharide synthase-like uncharacterized protein
MKVGFKGEVSAALKMVASGNQVFTTLCGFMTAASVTGAFALIWAEKSNWEVFLWIAGVSGTLSALSWFLSRRDTDLANGHATTIKWADGKLTLTADPRLGPPGELLEKAAKFATTLAHRQPLPPSSGFVDENFTPIANSAAEANNKISELNALAKLLLDQYAEKLGITSHSENLVSCEVPSSNDDAISRKLP